MSESAIERICARRVLPVVTLDDANRAVPLARALLAGGLDIIEFPLRTSAALDTVRRVRRDVPEMLVGAGTVLEPAQVDAALEAGAQFGVAPGLNDPVVKRANEAKWPFIPGVVTATEIERALGLGFRLLKFFPAEQSGGAALLKMLAAPYLHTGVRFLPLGGLNPGNARTYLELSAVAAVGGSWLGDRSALSRGDWPAITKRAKDALALASSSTSSA